MNVISTTIEFKGVQIKCENGKFYTWAFGTTIYKKNSPHWHWVEIDKSNFKPELTQALKEKGLI